MMTRVRYTAPGSFQTGSTAENLRKWISKPGTTGELPKDIAIMMVDLGLAETIAAAKQPQPKARRKQRR